MSLSKDVRDEFRRNVSRAKSTLLVALLTTLVAVLDGVVAYGSGDTGMILLDVALWFCASIQWALYFDYRTLVRILKIIEESDKA